MYDTSCVSSPSACDGVGDERLERRASRLGADREAHRFADGSRLAPWMSKLM